MIGIITIVDIIIVEQISMYSQVWALAACMAGQLFMILSTALMLTTTLFMIHSFIIHTTADPAGTLI